MFNYTGWVVGMSKSGKLLSAYATVGGPSAPPQDGTWTGGGGEAGIWMGGSGIASDNAGRLFFTTGNGKNGISVNGAQRASGRAHLDVLSECMVNLLINTTTGAVIQNDYFQPVAYSAMDAGDRDLGSGGIQLPDPSVFSGGGIERIAIACGKNSQCYITNADNLGGYKNGVAAGDAVLQTLSPPSGGAIFGNTATYPLEGGYLYVNPVGYPTYVYSLGFDASGKPAFTLVAQTDDASTGAVGVGPPTITTLKGQPGTAILWIADTNGIRAYSAVPVNGKMIKILLPAVPSIPKFQRPAFGNGRYYVITGSGEIIGFGAPVTLPLNCTSPVEFGSLLIGSTAVQTVNCTANTAITTFKGLSVGSTVFQASNSSLPQGPLSIGDRFSFPVTFNLSSSNYNLTGGSTSAPSVQPGVQTTALTIFTTNTNAGFSSQVPVSLTGSSVSDTPFLQIIPFQVTFSGIVVGSAASSQGSVSTFMINNIGQNKAKIFGYAFQNAAETSPLTNVTVTADSVLDVTGSITASDLPPVGTYIPGGGSVTVHVAFNTNITGTYGTILNIYSDGGNPYTILTGTASTTPIALLERSTNEGGWSAVADCTIPSDGCAIQLDMGTVATTNTLRFTNKGGSDLEITKSKPPGGSGAVIGASNPTTDFSEGLIIPAGKSTSAVVYFSPGLTRLNSISIVYFGTWTVNTNDLRFGVHDLNFTGTLVSPQVGPLFANGSAIFKYLGCFQDNTGSRIEPNVQRSPNNTNGLCQTNAMAAGSAFAGTEYQTECWTGSAIPSASLKVADSLCTGYTCAGDVSS
jgi:WSC domain-containing protein